MKLPAMTIERYASKDAPFARCVIITLENGITFDSRKVRKLDRDSRYGPLVEQVLMAVWDSLGRPQE
jgi:hypothetical protein